MYLTKKTYLSLTDLQIEKLDQLFKKLDLVYNEALDILREYYMANKKMISVNGIYEYYVKHSKLSFLSTIEPVLIRYRLFEMIDDCQYAMKRKMKVFYKSLSSSKHHFKLPNDFVTSIKKTSICLHLFKGETVLNNTFALKKVGSYSRNRNVYGLKIVSDNSSYYLIYALDTEPRVLLTQKTDGVGLDVGIKNLVTTSYGKIYPNVANLGRMKRLIKRKNMVFSKICKLKHLNPEREPFLPSNKMIALKKINRNLDKKIKNLRRDYLHKVSSEIINRNPRFIVIEDIKIDSLCMKNKSMASKFYATSIGIFLRFIKYKAEKFKIPLIVANEYFPSSKKCCNCGAIKNDLTLDDRVYSCPHCGFEVDRDINAAINLYKYGFRIFRNMRENLTLSLDNYYGRIFIGWKKYISLFIYKDK